jgi:hypothetical protein
MKNYKIILATAAFLASCAPDLTSYESFRASLDRFEDAYVVEGDILIHSEEELRAYHETQVALSNGIVTGAQGLVLNRINGRDDLYSHNTENNLTYCVSDDFNDISSTKKNAIVTAMAAAAADWENIIDVDFRYVSAEDDDCDAANTNVWFNVRPSGRADGWAYAFFPYQVRANREVRVGDIGGSAAQMTHELGHALGFRHEHERAEHSCASSRDSRLLSPYDVQSVMAYWSNASTCPGSSTYTITRFDTMGAQRVFGGPANACALADREVCTALGGECEVAIAANGLWRHDLCRWDNADTLAKCNATSGVWTYWNAQFAQDWPTAVLPGAYGACITQMNNVSCSAADEDTCLQNGATCERAISVSGTRNDLCRWSQVASASACTGTNGVWTAASSSFSQSWPTAVPDGQTNACVAQVRNLN